MSKVLGTPYSRTYLERTTPTADSATFRNRLSAYLRDKHHDRLSPLFARVNTASGFKITAYPPSYLDRYITGAPIVQLLDTITHIYYSLSDPAYRKPWLVFVEKVFREENVAYTVDEYGGVHPYVDAEFQHNKASAISALNNQRLTAVRAALDDAFRHLDGGAPDTKAAVRSIFESVEVIAKIIVPSLPRLNKNGVQHQLAKRRVELVPAGAVDMKVMDGLFVSLSHWADSLHDYRHGQSGVEIVRPPMDLAVYALSTGCAHLRWLAPYALAADSA